MLFNYREPGFGSGSEIRISGWIRIRNPDPEKSESLTSLVQSPPLGLDCVGAGYNRKFSHLPSDCFAWELDIIEKFGHLPSDEIAWEPDVLENRSIAIEKNV